MEQACPRCGGALEPLDGDAVASAVRSGSLLYHSPAFRYARCLGCGRLFRQQQNGEEQERWERVPTFG